MRTGLGGATVDDPVCAKADPAPAIMKDRMKAKLIFLLTDAGMLRGPEDPVNTRRN